MGLYAINCSICKTAFMWFSGSNRFQLCEECMKTAKFENGEYVKDYKEPKVEETTYGVASSNIPSAAELAEAWKNFKPLVPLSYTVAARKAVREK